MEIEVIKYTQESATLWDEFVISQSRNGGIFHERNFLSYHPPGKFIDESILLMSEGSIAGVIPAARNDERSVASHPGSTAGGLIYQKKAGLRDVLLLLEAAIMHYKKEGITSLELTLEEPVFSYPSDDELRYLLWHRGFEIKTREISSCVDLEGSRSWEFFGKKRNRSYINSLLEKGATVADLPTPDAIYPIIENNLLTRFNKKPTHTLDELRLLKSKYPERLHFWSVMLNGEPLGAIVTFDVNANAVHDFYIAQDYNHVRLQAMSLLFYKVFEYYQQRGFSWFNFGISSRADWIKWGVLEFKESMGGRASFRETWSYNNLSGYLPYKDKEL